MGTGKVLFFVEGLNSNSMASRMVNFGDNYGERYSFTEHVVATSPEEAIARVWDAMERRCQQHREKAKSILAEVRALEAQGKHREAAIRTERAIDFLGEISPFPPSVPRDREEWEASEVKVLGYRITVDPEVSSSAPS